MLFDDALFDALDGEDNDDHKPDDSHSADGDILELDQLKESSITL